MSNHHHLVIYEFLTNNNYEANMMYFLLFIYCPIVGECTEDGL